MRIVKESRKYRRDCKREKSGPHSRHLWSALVDAMTMLVNDQPLPQRYCDHKLGGQWGDCRDCHIRPDLILIYRKPDKTSIELIRLGSHSELGL